jgi:hypothetical protein
MGNLASTTRRRRPIRRLLLTLLDTRGRWWLSLWLWAPIAAAILPISCAARAPFGDYRHLQTGTIDIYVSAGEITADTEWTGDGFRLRHSSPRPPGARHLRTARVTCGYHLHQLVWTLTLDLIPEPSQPPDQTNNPDQSDEVLWNAIAQHVSPGFDAPDTFPALARHDLQSWLESAPAAMVRDRVTTRTRIPPPRAILFCLSLRACEVLIATGLTLALLAWMLRGIQIAYHTRALRRHESGRCPSCTYDISAAPDHPCPECGTDHRAARREAIDALRRANRWPLEGPVPEGP